MHQRRAAGVRHLLLAAWAVCGCCWWTLEGSSGAPGKVTAVTCSRTVARSVRARMATHGHSCATGGWPPDARSRAKACRSPPSPLAAFCCDVAQCDGWSRRGSASGTCKLRWWPRACGVLHGRWWVPAYYWVVTCMAERLGARWWVGRAGSDRGPGGGCTAVVVVASLRRSEQVLQATHAGCK